MTTYPTVAARDAAVERASDAKKDAFGRLQAALEAGEKAAAHAANDDLFRADREWRRVLNEEWRIGESNV